MFFLKNWLKKYLEKFEIFFTFQKFIFSSNFFKNYISNTSQLFSFLPSKFHENPTSTLKTGFSDFNIEFSGFVSYF